MTKEGEEPNNTPFSDIARRKRIKGALQEREEGYRDLLENTNDLIQSVQSDGRFLYVNRAWRETLGYTQKEISRLSLLDIIHPESRAHCMAVFQRVMSGESVDRVEAIFVTKTGEKVIVEGSANCKFVEGKPVATRGVFRNITERKRAGETLRESEEKLKAILENMRDVVFQLSPLGIIKYVSPKVSELYGYKPEDLIGKHLKKTTPFSEVPKALKVLKSVLSGEVVDGFEIDQRHAGGKIVPIEINAAPVRRDGKIIAVQGVMRDITERKRAERELQEKNEQLDAQNEELQSQAEELVAQQQELMEKTEEVEEANRLKSEFLAHMSHELRTPLNVIIGFSQLMVDEVPGKVNAEQRQCLDDILSSGKHLLNLVDDVLDLSKIESGKVGLKLADITMGKVIESLEKTIMAMLIPRKQSLGIEIEKGLPPVRADETKVGQVLLNLADNASKFTRDGGKIKIGAVREGNWCQVSVIDNGTGIKQEDQKRIFDPFCWLANPLMKGRNGTGLGLALARQIIERHGGRIWVESKYEKGSRFIFTLPLATRTNHDIA